ncbi:hypothetical protein, partial [Kitasatospora sp. NPDC059571]|uniref:hypothetical protein n=1 Tax=Kitasatospora sp. NPDC059571 TaxID=3346871 RepID=UPI003683C6AE
MRRHLLNVVLAVSGWLALLCTALPPAHPLRVAAGVAFLVVCPGLAVVRLVGVGLARRGRPMEPLETGVLAVALSLAIGVVVAEAYYLGHTFTVGRAVAVLAAVTTAAVVLTAVADRRGPPADRPSGEQGAEAGHDDRPPPGPASRRAPRTGAVAGAGLLVVSAALGRAGVRGGA